VAVSTPDADRLIAFYRDQLGLSVVVDQSWSAGVQSADVLLGLDGSAGRQVLLRLGNAYLELFEFASPAGRAGDPARPVCDHGYTHFCLDVVDVDEVYSRLSAAGVRFHSPPIDLFPGVRSCYSRDPDGNVVEFHQLAESHPMAVKRAS
jgi:catechol 2,3-dioxygenase-like lactoylglutathione lyase family enzyme